MPLHGSKSEKRKMSDMVFQKRYQRSAESASEIRVLDSISTGFDVGRGAPIARASTFDGWCHQSTIFKGLPVTSQAGRPGVPEANEVLQEH
jgi:hypothetical protein